MIGHCAPKHRLRLPCGQFFPYASRGSSAARSFLQSTPIGAHNTFDPSDELGEEVEYRIGEEDFVKREGLDIINSKGFRRGDLMRTRCGSVTYAAPEVYVSNGLYTARKADVWSGGIVLVSNLQTRIAIFERSNSLLVRYASWIPTLRR